MSEQITDTEKESNASLSTKEQIKEYRLSEEENDAEHSRNNTKILNERYSFVFRLFFGNKYRFILWLTIYAALYLSPTILEFCGNEHTVWISLIEKCIYALNFTFLALVTFPTAKGLRRLFREFAAHIAKK